MIDVDHAITIQKYGGFGQNAVSFKVTLRELLHALFFIYGDNFFRHYLITLEHLDVHVKYLLT